MLIERPPVMFRQLFPEALFRVAGKEKCVYLTFDDGPTEELTHWILKTLDDFGVKATFFCIGNNAEKHPEIVDEIRQNGHSVGIHGYEHRRGLYKEGDAFFSDIEKSKNIIKSNLFRPPHGNLTPRQAKKLKDLGYNVVLWDVITRDYNPSLSDEKVLDIAIKYTRNGSIVVFHDSRKAFKNMKYAFPKAVQYWLDNGYTFETL